MTNEELLAKRAAQPKVIREPETIADEAESILERLKRKAESEPPRAEPSHEQIQREIKLQELRARWKAPKRQLEKSNLDRSGEWAETERKVLKLTGTGFLVALIGLRGVGKTQIAVEAMRETTKRLKPALYCSAMDFFLDIKGSFKKDAKRSEKEVISDYIQPDLLVIDEFAKRGETDWENRLLFHLLDKRYQDCKDSLLIANQDKAEFVNMIGESLASRMQEAGGIIECNWKSFRS